MVLVVLISMLWTVWLVCLNVAPNATANYLMDTGAFDDGDYWLIVDSEPVLLAFTVLCLGCVIAVYGYVVLKMTRWRGLESTILVFGSQSLSQIGACIAAKCTRSDRITRAWRDLTGFRGRRRKLWVSRLSP